MPLFQVEDTNSCLGQGSEVTDRFLESLTLNAMYASYAQLVVGITHNLQYTGCFFQWFLENSFCMLGLNETGSPQFLTETMFSKFVKIMNTQYQLSTHCSTTLATVEGFWPLSAIF